MVSGSDPHDLGNISTIGQIVAEKFQCVAAAVATYEENTGTYVTRPVLLWPDVIRRQIIDGMQRLSNPPPPTAQRQLLAKDLAFLFAETQNLYSAAVAHQITLFREIYSIYKKDVIDNKRLRVIFYKAPTKIGVDYRFEHARRLLDNCTAKKIGDVLDDPWDSYLADFNKCLEGIKALNEEMSAVLEKVEKYSDDKKRLWVAIFSLTLALIVFAVGRDWTAIKDAFLGALSSLSSWMSSL